MYSWANLNNAFIKQSRLVYLAMYSWANLNSAFIKQSCLVYLCILEPTSTAHLLNIVALSTYVFLSQPQQRIY